MTNHQLKLDPLGYFLIRITEKEIEVAFCNYQKEILETFAGDSESLLTSITTKLPALATDHKQYLQKELVRAQAAIQAKADYIQE